jgi:CRISPR-associated protein Cmr1
MFIGDAQQNATGISPASVKGALRFWWRALNWGRIRDQVKTDTDALKELNIEEGNLFGTASDSGKASRFTLHVNTSSLRTPKNSDWPKGGNDPSGYLGMGLWKTGTTPARQYIPEGTQQTFSLSLISEKETKQALTTDQLQQLKDTLLAWGLFGGLGSRARRAFGAIAIEKIGSENYQFTDIQSYENVVNQLLEKYRLSSITEPPFSALSSDTSFSINKKLNNDARGTHAVLGQAFKDYRGQPSDLRGSRKKVFGLPLTDVSEERRASPLLFHIHPIDKQFTSAILYLPAKFHHVETLKQVDYSLAEGFLTKQALNTVIV